MVAAIQVRTRGVSQTEEYVPTHTVSQPDPQWYLAKMRDLYERDPQLLDPSWRAYFATETAPPQLRAKRPASRRCYRGQRTRAGSPGLVDEGPRGTRERHPAHPRH